MIEFHEAGYADGAAVIIREVTFSVAPGALCVLMGGPGSGKTTLLRLCRGDLASKTGHVLAFDEPVPVGDPHALARLRRRIGMIDRDPRFLDHASVRANVAAPLVAAGIAPEERAADIDDLLAWTGLAAAENERPAVLDSGERRRLALARAAIGGADVILADEPTAGQPPDDAQVLLRHLLDLQAMGRTLLVTTADAETAASLASASRTGLVYLEAGSARAVA